MNNDKPVDMIARGQFTSSHFDEIIAKYKKLKAELDYIRECMENNIDIFHRTIKDEYSSK